MGDDPAVTGSGSDKKGFRGTISRILHPKKTNKRDSSSTPKTAKNAPTSHLLEANNNVGNSQRTSESVVVPSSSGHAKIASQVSTPEVTSTPPIANVATSSSSNNYIVAHSLGTASKFVANKQAPDPVPVPPCPISELWDQAYEDLKVNEEKLMKEYECILFGDAGTSLGLVGNMLLLKSAKTKRKDQMEGILKKKVAEMKENEFKLRFNGKDIPLKDLAKPVLDIVNLADKYITDALSANPYASLAWAGVSLVLPVSGTYPRC